MKLVANAKRGQALRENRAVTVGSGSILLPRHTAADIRPTFRQVSSLVELVSTKELLGGESFKQPYLIGYGEADYTDEGAEYATAEPTFGYAPIRKAKITAYCEASEEVKKLPAAAYEAEVMRTMSIAIRKKLAQEILHGPGGDHRITGIFSEAATAIDPETDLELDGITHETLDEIVFSYGGEEEVGGPAVLVLNKKDLQAFSQLRTTAGEKYHDIKLFGTTGYIDDIPFIINSNCRPLSGATTEAGEYCMAYGDLMNYLLAVFSRLEVMKSDDLKFKEGLLAYKGVVFAGGNVVSKNGFLRIKRR